MIMMKRLVEKINFKQSIWVYGFVKTTLSGALISTGVVLIFNGITEHPWFQEWNEIAIICGFIAVSLAIIIIASIDKWREIQKRKELETIDEHTSEKVNNLARAIAEEKILEFLKEIEDE